MMLFGTLNAACIIYEYLTFTISFLSLPWNKNNPGVKKSRGTGILFDIYEAGVTHCRPSKMVDILQKTFSNAYHKNHCIFIKISLKFIPKGPIYKRWKKNSDEKMHLKMLPAKRWPFHSGLIFVDKNSQSILPQHTPNWGKSRQLWRSFEQDCFYEMFSMTRNPMIIFSAQLAFWGPSH